MKAWAQRRAMGEREIKGGSGSAASRLTGAADPLATRQGATGLERTPGHHSAESIPEVNFDPKGR